jgi:hypothetical protein
MEASEFALYSSFLLFFSDAPNPCDLSVCNKHTSLKSSAREKNQVQKKLDPHFAINISGNSPFGTPALMKNAERYEW